MEKNFDEWNGIKKKIHQKDTYLPLYHERQIRWCRPVGIIDGQESFVIISQLRSVDTKRLYKQIGTLDKEVFKVIRKAVKDML